MFETIAEQLFFIPYEVGVVSAEVLLVLLPVIVEDAIVMRFVKIVIHELLHKFAGIFRVGTGDLEIHQRRLYIFLSDVLFRFVEVTARLLAGTGDMCHIFLPSLPVPFLQDHLLIAAVFLYSLLALGFRRSVPVI